MGAKIFVGAAIATAVIIFLIVVVILQSQDWNELNDKIEAEAHEQELNEQFQKGIDQGYPQGVYDAVMGLIAQTEQDGFVQVPIDENTTYTLLNPAGCGQQAGAELQASGCEVRCP